MQRRRERKLKNREEQGYWLDEWRDANQECAMKIGEEGERVHKELCEWRA
jgi:hypothetical protein